MRDSASMVDDAHHREGDLPRHGMGERRPRAFVVGEAAAVDEDDAVGDQRQAGQEQNEVEVAE